MFGQALNFNLESGKDFILIETSMPFICKCMIFIFKDVRSLLKLQLASLPLKARILSAQLTNGLLKNNEEEQQRA